MVTVHFVGLGVKTWE